MATRVHVVAARGIERKAFLKAFKSFSNLEVEEDGGWMWFMASVWHVPASDLMRGLQTLQGTGLLLTTEDACRWYLSLTKPGEEPFVACHEFSLLPDDDAEDDAEEEEGGEQDIDASSFGVEERSIPIPTTKKGVQVYDDDGFFNLDEDDLDDDDDDFDDDDFDDDDFEGDDFDDDDFEGDYMGELIQQFEELGSPLPDTLVAALKGVSYGEACRTLLEWQSDQIVSALERFGLPHDPDEVRAIITGASVTPAELDSDIGNMPRFLTALGFGAQARKWLDEQTAPEEYDDDDDDDGDEPEYEDEHEDRDLISPVRDAVAGLPLTPVDGGPVHVPLEQAGYLYAIGAFCDEEIEGVLRLTPAGPDVMAFPPSDNFRVCQKEDGDSLDIGFSYSEGAFLNTPENLVSWLGALAEGSVVELSTAGPELDAGYQRYRGPVAKGMWQITETYPAMDAASLAGAVALVEILESGEPLMARDEAEVDAVLARAESLSDVFMGRVPRVEGRTFQVEEMFRSIIAQMCFSHRHGDVWDVGQKEALEAAAYAQLQQFKRDFDERLLANAPATDEIIRTSGLDTYRRGDLDKLPQVKAKTVAALDKKMRAAGFELLGDLWTSELPFIVMRCYGNEAGNAYGIAYFGMDDKPPLDLYTRFTDGASLTTTTLEGIYSMRAQKIFYRSSPATAPKGLLEDHQTGIGKLAAPDRQPEPITPSLDAVAEAIAEFSARKIQGYM